MRVTYKGRRNYGSSLVEIDCKENEVQKLHDLVGVMATKGWKIRIDTFMGMTWAFCPVEDSSTFRECFMQDWKEAKIELKNKEKSK